MLITLCTYQFITKIMDIKQFIISMLIIIIPFVINICTYKKQLPYEKWIYSIGYIFIYGMFSFAGMQYICFFTFPISILLIFFRDKKIAIITGFLALIIQLIAIKTLNIDITYTLIIQIVCTVLSFYCCYLVSRSFDSVYKEGRHNIHIVDRQNLKIADMMNDTIFVIAKTIDTKDTYTKGHSERVAAYSKAIAYKLGYNAEFCENIYKAGFLHDIGKIGIDDNILNKPNRLTDEEYDLMKKHVDIGANIVKDVKYIENIYDGVRFHHERWDGKGYPKGLSGTDIPLVARIIAGADMLDAMSSTRCYRKRLSKEVIISEIKRSSGTQLDPDVSQAILDLIDVGIILVDATHK